MRPLVPLQRPGRAACARADGDYFSIQVAGYPEGHPDRIKPVSELKRPLSADEKARLVYCDGAEFVCSDEEYEIGTLAAPPGKRDAALHLTVMVPLQPPPWPRCSYRHGPAAATAMAPLQPP